MQHRASDMRKGLTAAEATLWSALRNRQLAGLKFSRQIALGGYIVDFLCKEHRLVVEVDGSAHDFAEGYDTMRSAWLNAQGYAVMRVRNEDVFENIEGVCGAILEQAQRHPPPTPPSEEGGEYVEATPPSEEGGEQVVITLPTQDGRE